MCMLKDVLVRYGGVWNLMILSSLYWTISLVKVVLERLDTFSH